MTPAAAVACLFVVAVAALATFLQGRIVEPPRLRDWPFVLVASASWGMAAFICGRIVHIEIGAG